MNMCRGAASVEQISEIVLKSARYRHVARDLVRAVARQEMQVRRNEKETIKAVKNRLHQVSGAFFPAEPRYETWLGAIGKAVKSGDQAAVRAACRDAMRGHTSTRERLPILDRFYAETLADLPPIRSVLDVGCGLNPLAIPWMGLPHGATYTCCDVDGALVDFLSSFFLLGGIAGHAELRDVVHAPPAQPVDLVLALKLLPTLDQLQRDAGRALLDGLNAPHMLVSFPARTLCGRSKGMAANYEAGFLALAESRAWQVRRFAYPSEIAFLVGR
jgi:16S rRNA (guanine(1405)-N(7))-methyltransferase